MEGREGGDKGGGERAAARGEADKGETRRTERTVGLKIPLPTPFGFTLEDQQQVDTLIWSQ